MFSTCGRSLKTCEVREPFLFEILRFLLSIIVLVDFPIIYGLGAKGAIVCALDFIACSRMQTAAFSAPGIINKTVYIRYYKPLRNSSMRRPSRTSVIP